MNGILDVDYFDRTLKSVERPDPANEYGAVQKNKLKQYERELAGIPDVDDRHKKWF